MCIYNEFIFCLLPRIAMAESQQHCAHAYDMPSSSRHRASKASLKVQQEASFRQMSDKSSHHHTSEVASQVRSSVKIKNLFSSCPPLPRKSMLAQLCLGWCELLSRKCPHQINGKSQSTLNLGGTGDANTKTSHKLRSVKWCELLSDSSSRKTLARRCL